MATPDDLPDTAASLFSFLANDVRLAILESLYERTVEAGPLSVDPSYTTLKEDVGVGDSGRFSYHLDKLTGRFVAKTAAGYRLREPGREVVRLCRAGVLTSDREVDPVRIDARCYRCDAPVTVSYAHGHLITRCSECAGLVRHGALPEGTLTAVGYPPAGIDSDDMATAFDRSHVRGENYIRMMASGFCPRCGGDTTATMNPCTDHDPGDGICDACDLWHPAFASLSCGVCGHQRITHPLYPRTERGPVADLVDERGTSPGWERFAELLRWPVTVRDGDEVVVDAPDERRFLVDGDLSYTVE